MGFLIALLPPRRGLARSRPGGLSMSITTVLLSIHDSGTVAISVRGADK